MNDLPGNVTPLPGVDMAEITDGGNANASTEIPIDPMPERTPASREEVIAHLQGVEARLMDYLYSVRVTISLLAAP